MPQRRREDAAGRAAAKAEPSRLIVVGGGMAAQRLLEALSESGGLAQFDVTVLCEEPHLPYDRVNLGRVLSGEAPETLLLRDGPWYADHGIRVETKNPAVAIHAVDHTVETARGERLRYDRLVLATGARAVVPPVPGATLPGVYPYRSWADVERIATAARAGGRAVVVGGGLLGIEAARALQQLGCSVTILEAASRLMPRQIDEPGSELLRSEVERLGLHIVPGRRLLAIREGDDALRLEIDEGEALDADFVVMAVGIRPRDELGQTAGLACHMRGGVLVNDRLESTEPDILAVGECAHHGEEHYGIVAPTYEMANVAADRLCGGDALFQGAVPSTRLKLDTLDVCAAGDALQEGIGIRALSWHGEGAYRRVVLQDGRVIGALTIGSGGQFARLQEACARGERIRSRQERRFLEHGRLFRSGSEAPVSSWPDATLVCTCTGVTCGALRQACAGGARTVPALMERTGAGSVCRSCRPRLEELLGGRASSRRPGVGRTLVAASLAAGVAAALTVAIDPIPMSTSVVNDPGIDFLWRDGQAKRISGFTLVGLCAASLLLSLRKRWKHFGFGTFTGWRALHASLGAATLLAAAIHTGLRLGHNLNRVLMMSFLAVALLGSLAGAVTALESRLPASVGGPLRRGWTRIHVLAFWPLPVLIVFHVLAVYWY